MDVASQGETEEEALADLKEALELHLEPPRATRAAEIQVIEVGAGLGRNRFARSSAYLSQLALEEWEDLG